MYPVVSKLVEFFFEISADNAITFCNTKSVVVVPCGGPKRSPQTSMLLLLLHFMFLCDCSAQHFFESRVALNSGLGGVRDVASTIISHEQTQ